MILRILIFIFGVTVGVFGLAIVSINRVNEGEKRKGVDERV